MSDNKQEIQIGGQAVIEGVMMRGPGRLATAVRRKDKTIELKIEQFESITKRNRWLGAPVLRGFVTLLEMLIIGIRTLNFSASRAELDWTAEEQQNSSRKSENRKKAEEILSFILAFGLAFLLFAFLPYQIAAWLKLAKENLFFNLFAGLIRIIFFVVYVWLIGRMKDVKRLFQYHGAEHKSVFAYEQDAKLDPVTIRSFSTFHPRCGTSYIFFVLLISILLFSLIDTIVAAIWTIPPVMIRLAYHLLFLPLISGISYEILRLSSRNISHPLVQLMTAPGLALQRITTQPPDDEQVEVALIAMKCALEMDISDYHGIRIIE